MNRPRRLDAEAMYEPFGRYAQAARKSASRSDALDRRTALLFSHRFSTVRMANLIAESMALVSPIPDLESGPAEAAASTRWPNASQLIPPLGWSRL